MRRDRNRTGIAAALALSVLVSVGVSPAPTAEAQEPCGGSKSYQPGGAPTARRRFNDPLYPRQWALDQINADAAWRRGALGKGAVVAIVDGGVDMSHPDLRAQLVKGIDLAGEGEAGDCPGPQDRVGHGTHVAGIVAAIGGNRIGTVGVAPRARIMPVQVLHGDEESGPLLGAEQAAEVNERVAEGIRYAAEHGADVINVSLTTSYVTDVPVSGISEAIEFAWNEGAVVVAAAGNDDLPYCNYPAADALVVCVGATDRDGEMPMYSNDPAKPIGDPGVLAPGGNDLEGGRCETSDLIWSTVVPLSWDCGVKGYGTNGGTSMASPHVAGVAALLSAEGLTNQEIVDCLKETSSNEGQADSSSGYGLVDAGAAVKRCT